MISPTPLLVELGAAALIGLAYALRAAAVRWARARRPPAPRVSRPRARAATSRR